MTQPDFVFGYLPFWIVNYGLAVVLWSCLGRFLLSLFVPSIQPGNYIWRAFRALTDWAVASASFITPRFIPAFFLPPIAAFWLFYARVIFFIVMWNLGLVPTLTPQG